MTISDMEQTRKKKYSTINGESIHISIINTACDHSQLYFAVGKKTQFQRILKVYKKHYKIPDCAKVIFVYDYKGQYPKNVNFDKAPGDHEMEQDCVIYGYNTVVKN